MIKITFLEFLLRGLPEGFLFLLMFYILARKKIELKIYILASIFSAILSYLLRFLPIILGINSIINIFFMILFCVKILKVNINKSIQIVLFIYILEFVCELLNMLLIEYIFHLSIATAFKSPYLKLIYGLPSLLMFAFCVLLAYLYMKKDKQK